MHINVHWKVIFVKAKIPPSTISSGAKLNINVHKIMFINENI